MARRVSTVVASVFRFETVIRREGQRGQRITIPAAVVRGLRHQGWGRKMFLRIVIGETAWAGIARRTGNAIVVAVPAACGAGIGDAVVVELWPAVPVVRDYLT